MTQPAHRFVPKSEIDRVLALDIGPIERTRIFADIARFNTLYMIKQAGSGHVGSSFSSLDVVSWLFLNGLRRDPADRARLRDVYFSSKGHDAPGLYCAMIGAGFLDFELIDKLRRLEGLPGHPDVHTPNVPTNTGSLGMGISKARGMILAARLAGESRRFFVLTGDGELQEGQFWESLQPSVNRDLYELTVIVDHNKIQSDTWVERVSSLGDLDAKFAAFGWRTARVDGHDMAALERELPEEATPGDGPRIIIADTIKGRGVSFMEDFDRDGKFYAYHSGAPSDEDYALAAEEIIARVNGALSERGHPVVVLEERTLPAQPAAGVPSRQVQKLVGAYGRALVDRAAADERIVALDADLVLDTGLTEFAERYPERFFECGIAEQDMVSQAGGMALSGLLPVVHSFACFLSTRPNEQIYNNATEGTKIIYAGSLAGLLPAGPGHSHQSVRDISALAATPGLVLVEPSTEREVCAVVDYCLSDRLATSAYIRLVTIPCEIPFELPAAYELELGRGVALTEGRDAVLFGYGPVLLPEAYRAAEQLARDGIDLRVVNMPWLNRVDSDWLRGEIAEQRHVFTLDDHYLAGGQGEMLAAAIARLGLAQTKVTSFGVEGVPLCGRNDEVLRAHGLDAESLTRRVREALR